MSAISRLILLQQDDRAGAALRFAFEREGYQVAALSSVDGLPAALEKPASLLLAGARGAAAATATLLAIRQATEAAGTSVPVLYVGNGIDRNQALAGGASEMVAEPAFVRDVVTVARLVAGRRPDAPAVFAGDLGEHFGMFFLVRAVVMLRRRGVLTIVRGLRRGELRFYDGEVTSAQVGVLHGQAALHQLLLWTAGRFELRPENVVRRRQIPLDPAELLIDCERFLTETRQVADRLSPAALYEGDQARAGQLGQPLPEAVALVWRLFDGTRTLADVVEDSPFRMFETLQVANQLAHLGLLRERRRDRAVRRPRTALAIEEWLGGAAGRRNEIASAVDWSAFAPSRASELPSPPSVVPSTVAAGEISVARDRRATDTPFAAPAREGVEEVGAARLQSLFVDPAALDAAQTVPFQRVVLADDLAGDDVITDRQAKIAPVERRAPATGAAPAQTPAGRVEWTAHTATPPAPVPAATSAASPSAPIAEAGPPTSAAGEIQVASLDRAAPAVNAPAVVVEPEPPIGIAVAPSSSPAVAEPAPASGSGPEAIPRPIPTTAELRSQPAEPGASGQIAEIERSAPTSRKDERTGKYRKVDGGRKKDKTGKHRKVDGGRKKDQTGKHRKVEGPKQEQPGAAPAMPATAVASSPASAPVQASSAVPAPSPPSRAPVAEVAAPVMPFAVEPVAARPSPPLAAAALALADAVPEPVPVPNAPSRSRPITSPPAAADHAEQSARHRAPTRTEIDRIIRTADTVFTADEEAFFAAGHELAERPPAPGESFEDLDEGYDVPRTFWQRLLRRPNTPLRRKP